MNRVTHHENILKILDFRVTKYHFAIVMELCEFNLNHLKLDENSKFRNLMPTELVIHMMAPIVQILICLSLLKL